MAEAQALIAAVKRATHEVWCDSLPRGTWVPTRCNCVLSDIVAFAEDLEAAIKKEEGKHAADDHHAG